MVCENKFNIEEEITNPSSIILNKVYPKAWKGTNKLLKEYYFPQDYSKCLIKEYGKNLFDKDNANALNAYFNKVTTKITSHNSNRMLYLKCLPNTTYTVSRLHTGGNTFFIGYTNETPVIGSQVYNIKTNEIVVDNRESLTLTTGAKAQYIVARYYHTTADADYTEQELLESIQIEKGSIMTSFESYETLIFAGIVKNTADMNLNPFKPHFCSLQILDPSTLLSEGKVLDYVIANKTIEEAINQVIDSISDYGFVAGNINIPEKYNTVIGAYSTLDKAPFDVFQYLSQISLTRWGTRTIDEDTTAIDFFDPDELESGEPILLTEEYFKQNKICDLNYDYSTTDYRNKQIITSDEVFGNVEQKQILISNGYDTTYIIEQKIGKINSIMVNGSPATFVTNEEKKYGIEADFYYTVLENQVNSAQIYSAGTQIQVNYIPIVKGREVSINNGELGRIYANLGRNGAITRYENRNDVTDSKELQAVGQSYIKFKGIPEITLTLTSRKDFLKLGEKHYFEAPLQELKSDYLVKAKTTSILQNGEFSEIIYTYKLTNSFDTENEINYFDNQRAKNNGNISQGEYITRNIDIENTANIIFSNLTVEEITIEGDNVLDSVLDSPFTQ